MIVSIKQQCAIFIWMFFSFASDCVAKHHSKSIDILTEFETKADELDYKTEVSTFNEFYYFQYEKFLDTELNRTYQKLMHSLDKTAQQKLKASQRAWLKYRDAETLIGFHFYFTPDKSKQQDSESNKSRFLDDKLFIIRDRVRSLIKYLQNVTRKK
jgi:uncharacterized protein YecT (DUF1311 family)